MTLNRYYQFEIPDNVYSKFHIPDNNRDLWWHRCGDRSTIWQLAGRPVLLIDVPINWKGKVGDIVKGILDKRRDPLQKDEIRTRSFKIIYRLPPTYDRTELLDTCLRAGDGEGYEIRTHDIDDEESKWFCVDFTPTD